MEDQAALEVPLAQGQGRLEQTDRGFGLVKIEFRIALVRGDEEVELLCQLDEPLQDLDGHDGPRGIARRADVKELAALPGGGVNGIEVRYETLILQTGQILRFGTGQEGGALIYLVKGLGISTRGERPRSTMAWAKAKSPSRLPLRGRI